MNLFELIRSRIADPKRPFLIGADGSTLSYGDILSHRPDRQYAGAVRCRARRSRGGRSKGASKICCSIWRCCARELVICRSTPPIRSPSSTISSAMPSPSSWSATRRSARGSPSSRGSAAWPRSRRWTPKGKGHLTDTTPAARRRRILPMSLARTMISLPFSILFPGHHRPLQGRDAHA